MATIPTRTSINAGDTLFFSHSMWHSGDIYSDADNERIHGYCLSKDYSIKESFSPGYVYHHGRSDIKGDDFEITYVHTSTFPNFPAMYKVIEDTSLHPPPTPLDLRKHRALCLLLALWEILALKYEEDNEFDNIFNLSTVLYCNILAEIDANAYIDHQHYVFITIDKVDK